MGFSRVTAFLATLIAMVLMVGCASAGPKELSDNSPATETSEPPDSDSDSNSPQNTNSSPVATSDAPEISKTELNGESLFQLLLAEIATNRQQYPIAAALYREIGNHYNDVEAISRATLLYRSIGDYEKMNGMASRWISLRPDDVRALRAYTASAIATGTVSPGVETLRNLLTLAPDTDVSFILPASEQTTADEQEVLKRELAQLTEEFPESTSLVYTQARLEFLSNNPEAAMTLADDAIRREDDVRSSLLKFELLMSMDNADDAKAVIEPLVSEYPGNREIAVQYARYLFRYEALNLETFETLYSRFPAEEVIIRTYARSAFEASDLDVAEALYSQLLERGVTNEAHYFLGRIDLENERKDAAAAHFSSIDRGPYLTSAMAEWISMARPEDETALVDALTLGRAQERDQAPTLWRLQASYYQLISREDDAWTVLDDAIVAYPRNIGLLYDQAMLAASFERYATLENNLLAVLELEPNNANALNALGYTWADINKNLDAAGEYIERALLEEPDNPAFQDSKGWYLYRVGRLDDALEWLFKAYAQLKNDEVAAHIAEVLWVLNRKSEARGYLAEVEQLNPESTYLPKLYDLFENN